MCTRRRNHTQYISKLAARTHNKNKTGFHIITKFVHAFQSILLNLTICFFILYTVRIHFGNSRRSIETERMEKKTSIEISWVDRVMIAPQHVWLCISNHIQIWACFADWFACVWTFVKRYRNDLFTFCWCFCLHIRSQQWNSTNTISQRPKFYAKTTNHAKRLIFKSNTPLRIG